MIQINRNRKGSLHIAAIGDGGLAVRHCKTSDQAAVWRLASGAGLMVLGLGLETALMARSAAVARGLGPICGHAITAIHCPACTLALAMMTVGGVLLLAPGPPRKVAVLARPPRRAE